MKKLMALALVALLSSAVQAISVDWSNTSSLTGATITQVGNNASSAGSGNFSISGVSSWTIVMDVSFTSVNANNNNFKWLLTARASQDATTGGAFRTNVAALTFAETQTTGGTWASAINRSVTTLAANTSYEFALSYDSTTSTLSFYLDGSLVGSTTDTSFAEVVYYTYGQDSAGTANQLLASYTSYTADVYTVTGATYSDLIIATVPEPTCLALLALGVAGLALRRRA